MSVIPFRTSVPRVRADPVSIWWILSRSVAMCLTTMGSGIWCARHSGTIAFPIPIPIPLAEDSSRKNYLGVMAMSEDAKQLKLISALILDLVKKMISSNDIDMAKRLLAELDAHSSVLAGIVDCAEKTGKPMDYCTYVLCSGVIEAISKMKVQ